LLLIKILGGIMMEHSIWKRLLTTIIIIFTVVQFVPYETTSAQVEEFPQKNAWTRVTPSVVWCGDTEDAVTIEVHIVGRNDVARVWVTNLGTSDTDARAELWDNGTHSDLVSGDNVFTLGDAVLPCSSSTLGKYGWNNWWGFLRVQLDDGSSQENNYGLVAGLVGQKYKGSFTIQEFGNGLSATAYAFFIVDEQHQVMDNYPVANVYCGTGNYQAYRKLYSVLPDNFDIALVTPGMQIFRPKDLAENVPYNVLVSNDVQNIGMPIMNNAAQFGSAGRLKSAIYQSFGEIQVFDHEIGHTWGAAIGQSLGLLEPGNPDSRHWNPLADMQGQMGAYYFNDSGAVGHFLYNGDEVWKLIKNTTNEPYSSLELYMMGFIPPEEVPPIHVLQSPDTSNTDQITATSYSTVTIQDIMNASGGARVPDSANSQKEFTVAYIVTQDTPYNDASYAFFSLIANNLMTKDPPQPRNYFAPFYWATGGRGTLNVRLPVDLPEPTGLPGMAIPTQSATQTSASETSIPVTQTKTTSNGPGCGSAPAALLVVTIGLSLRRKRKELT
jgi:hypothetical protein